jgi:hypothetical protein
MRYENRDDFERANMFGTGVPNEAYSASRADTAGPGACRASVVDSGIPWHGLLPGEATHPIYGIDRCNRDEGLFPQSLPVTGRAKSFRGMPLARGLARGG